MTGRKIKEALISLICQLVHYTEEGLQLFPEILIFDDLKGVLESLPNGERVAVGNGPMGPESLSVALKQCAPLAQWGWTIYILRVRENVQFGLLRSGLTALSLSPSELLISHGNKALPAIGLRHISQSTLELSGSGGNSLTVHFGAAGDPQDDPAAAPRRFCEAAVKHVDVGVQEVLSGFYARLLSAVSRAGRGCLAAVLRPGPSSVPGFLKDGVVISPPLDVSIRVLTLLKRRDCESDARLRAAAALIRGMLMSDGITVFGSEGTLRAYNVFVKMPELGSPRVRRLGGARQRAFERLSARVERELLGVLLLSQDGHAEFRGE